ncbi:cell division cycle-associated protein 4 isoform X2 [Camelus dromedarius]|nr:cell division cycle-associated protein 4 isoform X1 [Camelus dromedarius]XP_031310322.1 cell division cycle-associated protein 4 isoform X1 [Camelus dromedarius]
MTRMMFARGLKRKCAEDEEAAPSYSRQRQSLLDMSLVKLQLCHALAEPSLCRSVLIANTVRQIQEEMTQDGAWRGAAPQTTGRAPLDRLVSTDLLCRSVRDGAGDGPAAPAPRGLQSSIWEGDGPLEDKGSFQKSLDQILETLESNTPLSVDELFSDVDSSYCSLDAVLTGVVGGAQSGQDGLEALAAMAAPAPSTSCKSDLGELDHVVGILVET